MQAKELTMPAEHGVWLHNQQSLLLRSNQPGQQDEEHAIGPRERWPFHLPLEDDELLSQGGNFREQFGLASAQIGEGGQQQGGSVQFRPMSQASRECMHAASQEALESEKNTCHTKKLLLDV